MESTSNLRAGDERHVVPSPWVHRISPALRAASLVGIALGLAGIARRLPLTQMAGALEGRVRELGVWGPLVYGLIYVVAVVALAPASALTIAAGAIFGPLIGTVVVSLASTTGAALAFLISRHLAREAVARRLGRDPRFAAIDRAIGDHGWKIVAMLRLSPAVPFNLQNYLYGLTRIGFWACVLTSWITMLPGTLMYVYLGYAGRASLEAASGGRTRSPAEWALLAIGLAATVLVTVYVTRLARKSLQEQADLAQAPEVPRQEKEMEAPVQQRGWTWGTTLLVVTSLGLLTLGGYVQLRPDAIETLLLRLAGPPRVVLREAYAANPSGPHLDHSEFDDLLRNHVSEGGGVDYLGMKRDLVKLDSYLNRLANAPFDALGRDEKLAALINAYNAFTVKLILDHYPIDSIQSIPSAERWDAVRWRVGTHTWSLNQIEHEQIRPKFREPRIHFALVCAAVGCPSLRSEAYSAGRIDEQLDDQARYVNSHDRWVRFNITSDALKLTSLYKWYGSDFEQVADSIPQFVSRYIPALKKALDAGRKPAVAWLDYDWSLNSKENLR